MEPLVATLSLLVEWKQSFVGMGKGARAFSVPWEWVRTVPHQYQGAGMMATATATVVAAAVIIYHLSAALGADLGAGENLNYY